MKVRKLRSIKHKLVEEMVSAMYWKTTYSMLQACDTGMKNTFTGNKDYIHA
jgi:hypothetical protein